MSDQDVVAPEEVTEETVEAVAEPAAEVDSPADTPDESSPVTEAAQDESASDESDENSLKIEQLEEGQHLIGTVKNITEFGAFVDVGIPQDGLVHISKLARRKVEKVSDVVSQGQEVEVWVKKVDAQRGRLSLTMIKPIKLRMRDIDDDMELDGVVTRLESYGAFLDIGSERDGLVHISQITHEYIKHPEEALTVGDTVRVKILKVNRKKRQVDLSIKALVEPPPPPEEPVKEKPARRPKQQFVEEAIEQEVDDRMTSMAVAYAALQGTQSDSSEKESRKRRKNKAMEDVISRTLATHES